MEFALDGQIASHPRVVRGVLDGPLDVRLDPDRPIVFSGIGTSLHAARVAAYWVADLTGGALRPAAVDAHDLALHAPITARDQVVVISHRGWKRYPNAALARARAVGARTVAVVGEEAPEPEADDVVRTCPDESSGTFTVSYLASLAALGRIVAPLGGSGTASFERALGSVPEALERTLEKPPPGAVAERLARVEPVMISGFGLDAVTAEEAALKVKEGAYLWAEAMSTEFALHGTPAVYRAGMAAITIDPGDDDGGRTRSLRDLLGEIGIEAVYECGDRDDADLPFAPVERLMRPLVAIVPFQRLTAELARVRGTNPDLLHKDLEPWGSAMTRVEL